MAWRIRFDSDISLSLYIYYIVPLKKTTQSHISTNYVRVVTHKIPGGKQTIKVKAGTQIIDRAWRFLKDRMPLNLNQNSKVGSKTLRAMLRSAQNEYWHTNADLWVSTGILCSWEMAKLCRRAVFKNDVDHLREIVASSSASTSLLRILPALHTKKMTSSTCGSVRNQTMSFINYNTQSSNNERGSTICLLNSHVFNNFTNSQRVHQHKQSIKPTGICMQIFCTVCSRWVSGGSIYIYIHTHSTEEHFSLALVDVQLLGFLQASICQLCRCWSGSNRRGHAELPVFGSCLVLSICSFFFVVLTCCFFASVFCGFSFWSVWREDVLRTRTAFRSCW